MPSFQRWVSTAPVAGRGIGRASVPCIALPVLDVGRNRRREDSPRLPPRPRWAPLLHPRPVETTAVECSAYSRYVEAQRALRTVPDAERPELDGMVTHPLL